MVGLGKDQLAGAFIAKKIKQLLRKQRSLPAEDETDPFEDTSCQTEDNHIAEELNGSQQECTWEYHILYSPSYATPVLFFNVFTSDGHLVPLESLWKGGTQGALQHLRWEALSQQEHPVLRRPYYYLHPCKTAELLNLHQGSSTNPIVTWLSSMGPAIGLHLDIAYGHLVQNQR
ncbi:ubiquitin-like-conjugating enzyme ATG10 isoform X2 [Thrips palmi]|uniref:Ubiquitin-like-conjugating enzyme ATG10 n=1 Tax=Thrips palmi TaxID=161013 RepID=A0A6P8Y4E6_THRPL|nr:ubiquitin-like-conjugating enzyme ATG10 isoform X2 [Thrips palmi]